MSAYPKILLSSNGTSAPCNIAIGPTVYFGASAAFLGLIATVSPGASLIYTVQVTADANPSPSGNWNNHDVLANRTSSQNGAQGYPVTAIRLVVTDYLSGSVNLGIAQWP